MSATRFRAQLRSVFGGATAALRRIGRRRAPRPGPGARAALESGGRSGDFEALMRRAGNLVRRRGDHGLTVARNGEIGAGGLTDCLLSRPGDPNLPDEVFDRLRWGGTFACVGADPSAMRRLAQRYDADNGFDLERGPEALGPGCWFSARKTRLIRPGQISDRFTYDVALTPDPRHPGGFVVTKSVPSYASICYRLHKRIPSASIGQVQDRARKLVDYVFPTFLTREAAFLQILARDLPARYRRRVPRLISVYKDRRGFVTRLQMNWLRIGGRVLSQLEFATQAAELLTVLHDRARVLHLDLRPDNIVITPEGVGFVDFGSAVRIGERLGNNPMLATLFTDLMRASQIQRMLGQMADSGKVTSRVLLEGHRRVDKCADLFYLAVQLQNPRTNPDFRHLIRVERGGVESRLLTGLTRSILRPAQPDRAPFRSAADILRGVRKIEQEMSRLAA